MKVFVAGLCLALALSVPALAQAPIDILVVDETDGFVESIAVNLIVGLLRQEVGLFGTVDALFADVDSPFDLPFEQNPKGRHYDLVLIAPKNVLELRQIWIVTPTYTQQLPELNAALTFMNGLAKNLSEQYQFSVDLLDVSKSLFVGILSAFFCKIGILTHP